MNGIELIAQERGRQLMPKSSGGEGWTDEHDDAHEHGELAMAAVSYALWDKNPYLQDKAKALFPWDLSWFKPKDSDTMRNLVKAGALIAAEIDRLQRQQTMNNLPSPQTIARFLTKPVEKPER